MQTRSYVDAPPIGRARLRACEIIISDVFLA